MRSRRPRVPWQVIAGFTVVVLVAAVDVVFLGGWIELLAIPLFLLLERHNRRSSPRAPDRHAH